MRRSLLTGSGLLAAALLAGTALTQTRPQPPADPDAPPEPTSVILAPDRADAAALARARQDPLAARLRGVLAQSPARAAAPQIQASTVPVLGPSEPALLATARFHPGDRQYTLVVRDGETIIEIFGTTRALRSPAAGPLPAPLTPPQQRAATRGPTPMERSLTQAGQAGLTQVRAERTEYGVDVGLVRFGAAYNVSFICGAPGGADCTEARAVAFAASLVLLGGGQ